MQEFDECLRTLQTLIKSQKASSDKTSEKKSSLKRQTFRQVVQLRKHLRVALADHGGIRNKNTSDDGKKQPLQALQVHCEKLLNALLLIKQLQDQLTNALRRVIAECFGLLFLAGSSRTLFENLAKWIEMLNDKKTCKNVRCSLLVCLEYLFQTQGKNISSYMHDVVGVCTKQFKLSSHEFVQVRLAAASCVCEGLSFCGGSSKHAHASALKFFQNASKDKSAEVRRQVGKGLESLALASNIFASVALESLLNVVIKAIDAETVAAARLAFARAASTIMTISILNPIKTDPTLESKPVKKGLFNSGQRKKILSFSILSAVDYLCAKIVKASSCKSKLGFAHALIDLIKQPSTSEIVMLSANFSSIIDKLIGLVQPPRVNYLRTTVTFILRQSFVNDRSEHHLHKTVAEISGLLRPSKSDLLEDNQIVILLTLLSHALSPLGDAGGSLGTRIVKVLNDLVVHSNHLVRLEAAACARTLMAALPSFGSTMLDLLVDRMVLDHGELVGLAVTGNSKKRPSQDEQIKGALLLIGLRGRSLAVAALLLAVPACPLGVPRSSTNTVFYLSTALLHQYSDDDMLASASSACARAGWTLISGVIGLGPSTFRPHLRNMMTIWKEVCRPRGPHSLNAKTSLAELQVLTASMGALLLLLSSWPTLHADDPESMDECVECVLNVVSALSPPHSSLSALSGGNTVDSLDSTDATFISLYATSLEACARLVHAEQLQSALPALVQSTVSAFVDGVYGQTSLLEVLPMLDSSDVPLQLGERLWPGVSRGPFDDAYHVEDVDILEEPYLLKLADDYSSLSSPLEQEIALINAMAWAAPIVATGAGKGQEIIGPRRTWRTSDGLPSPRAMQRHVDAALGLFCSVFPILAAATRRQVLDGFVKSLNGALQKANATTTFALRNILTAMLGASKAMVATGDDQTMPTTKEKGHWQSVFKSLLIKTLNMEDSLTRRAAAEAIGYASLAMSDKSFAKAAEKALYAPFKFPQPEKGMSESHRAGAIFALACVRRRLGGMYRSSLVPSPFFYNEAKKTTQPVRSWALHSWWLVLNTISVDFHKYVQPTMNLIRIHLLAGRITETDREREQFEESTDASVSMCIARLMNSLVTGLGPELITFPDMNQLWACLEQLKLSSFEVVIIECLYFIENVAMFSPQDPCLFDTLVWVTDRLQNGSFRTSQKAVSCIRRIVQRDNDLAFEMAPYLFYELDHRYSSMEIAPAVTPLGSFGISSSKNSSVQGVQSSVLTTTLVPALQAADGVGLLRLGSGTSPRGSNHEASMRRHALVQDIRDALVEMAGLNTECPPEWTHKWFNILQSIIVNTREARPNGSGDEDEEDIEKSEEGTPNGKTGVVGSASTGTTKLPMPEFWPLVGVRWQTKNVALECMRKLVRLASISIFSKEHFDVAAAKAAGGDFLVLHLREIIQIACMTSTASAEGGELYRMQTLGITFIGDIIEIFAQTKDPAASECALLLQYEAQLNSALRPCFKKESYPPLTIHACRSVASLISLGISTDLAMARRAVKTLVDDAELGVEVRPCRPEKHQEHVSMCKLLARIAALGTLQVSTVDPIKMKWTGIDRSAHVGIFSTSNVRPDMRKALSKALAPSLPKLRLYWFAALRDYVSLYARAAATSGGKKVAIPVPVETLLEYNEDASQVAMVFEELWPIIAQAVASLGESVEMGSGEELEQTNYDLLIGVCLRFLARTPTGDDSISYTLPIAKKCFTVLRWLFSPSCVSIERIAGTYAIDIINVIANGVANVETGHPHISNIASELICMIVTANPKWLKEVLKPVVKGSSDCALAHVIIEFSSKILHQQLRSLGNLTINTSPTSFSHQLQNKDASGRTLLYCNCMQTRASLQILSKVYTACPSECRDQYRPSILRLIVSIHITLVGAEGDDVFLIMETMEELVSSFVKVDTGSKDTKLYKLHQLYESAVAHIVDVLFCIGNGEAFELGYPEIIKVLFTSSMTMLVLCRTDVCARNMFKVLSSLKSCMGISRGVKVNFGAVCCVRYILFQDDVAEKLPCGITRRAVFNFVGHSLALLLQKYRNRIDDHIGLKSVIIKVFVQSALQVSQDDTFAIFLLQILASFQELNTNTMGKDQTGQFCAQCALQLLTSGQERFKLAVQQLSSELQGLLQDGLQKVMTTS
jgi:hypothetical protein